MSHLSGVPIENRRFCGVPFADEANMNWDELLQDRPLFPSNDGTAFMVKYDDRQPKPACLAPYDDVSYAEAVAIGNDPTSIWHKPFVD